MNRLCFLILCVFVFSCVKDKEAKKDAIVISIEDLSKKDSTNAVEVLLKNLDGKTDEKQDSEDCIFDQKTQTDEFLNGIEELKDYIWNQEAKTAEIILNDHWSLTIKRGGCNHFEVSATFIYDRFLEFDENKKSVYDKFIWISGLLEEFDEEAINEAITNNNISIEVDEDRRFIQFMDSRLYESYSAMFYSKNNVTHIRLSYYLN